MDARSNGERIVVLGQVSGAFGVAGWLKVQSYTDPPENLLKYPVWSLRSAAGESKGEWTTMRLLQGRIAARTLHAQLEKVTTREQAASLRGTEIGVPRCELPKLRRGEYYWDDLVGLDAYAPDGEHLGKIAEIRATPAHPLLRVIDQRGANDHPFETWVPLVRDRVSSVDLASQRVVLDWRRDW